MTSRPANSRQPLHTREGELVLLSFSVEPRLLEALLDTLEILEFPVNPQLYHRPGQILVEFPAYAERIKDVQEALGRNGFDVEDLAVARSEGKAAGC